MIDWRIFYLKNNRKEDTHHANEFPQTPAHSPGGKGSLPGLGEDRTAHSGFGREAVIYRLKLYFMKVSSVLQAALFCWMMDRRKRIFYVFFKKGVAFLWKCDIIHVTFTESTQRGCGDSPNNNLLCTRTARERM